MGSASSTLSSNDNPPPVTIASAPSYGVFGSAGTASGGQLFVSLRLVDSHPSSPLESAALDSPQESGPSQLVPHVVGAHPLVGAWDPLAAVPMERDSLCAWQLNVVLPAQHAPLEFKVVLKTVGGMIMLDDPCLLEEGPPRQIIAGHLAGPHSSRPARFLLRDLWRKVEGRGGEGGSSAVGGSVGGSAGENAGVNAGESGEEVAFPVEMSARAVSPFVLAAAWKLYDGAISSQGTLVRGIPDVCADALPLPTPSHVSPVLTPLLSDSLVDYEVPPPPHKVPLYAADATEDPRSLRQSADAPLSASLSLSSASPGGASAGAAAVMRVSSAPHSTGHTPQQSPSPMMRSVVSIKDLVLLGEEEQSRMDHAALTAAAAGEHAHEPGAAGEDVSAAAAAAAGLVQVPSPADAAMKRAQTRLLQQQQQAEAEARAEAEEEAERGLEALRLDGAAVGQGGGQQQGAVGTPPPHVLGPVKSLSARSSGSNGSCGGLADLDLDHPRLSFPEDLPEAAGAVAAAAAAERLLGPKERRRLAIIMVGLPARGKTFTAAKLTRYLRWLGHETKHFNVGKYRRLKLGASQTSDFFRADNFEGIEARNEALPLPLFLLSASPLIPKLILPSLPASIVCLPLSFFCHRSLIPPVSSRPHLDPQVGVFDATNSTRARRNMLLELAEHKCKVIFLECICDDASVIDRNAREKIKASPDYTSMADAETALNDFRSRLDNYQQVYEPVEEGSYIKLINMVSGSSGQLQVISHTLAVPCHTMPCHATSCHATSCHATSCHATSCHAMPWTQRDAMTASYIAISLFFCLLTLNTPPLFPFRPSHCHLLLPSLLFLSLHSPLPLPHLLSPCFPLSLPACACFPCVHAWQVNNISGYLPGRIVFFLLNTHITPRPVLLTRHGESMDNVRGRIGGDPLLSPAGEIYAEKLSEFVHKRLRNERLASVWTSTLRRTIRTGRHIAGFPKVQWRALDEIDAGVCDGMTYLEIRQSMPDEYRSRKADKLRYRYPRGESYLDVIQRLEPVIIELERQRHPVVIIAHQAVLRALYAYFMDKPLREVPHIEMPLHTIIELTTGVGGITEKRFKLTAASTAAATAAAAAAAAAAVTSPPVASRSIASPT
ncbi:unnamed protein product [Closterium sp. NIES-54]